MAWQDLDPDSGRITLPDTKTGPRRHDLPKPVLDILSGLPKKSKWIFPSGKSHIKYPAVRRFFHQCAASAGLSDVRIHDLRRTYITRAAINGVETHVLRDMLGHKTAAMADRYIRAIGKPVRLARERIGNEIASVMELSHDTTGPVRPQPHIRMIVPFKLN